MFLLSSKMRLIILTVALLGCSKVFSQQEPQFTQYMFNTISVNPAYAGTNNTLNALLLTRQQWVGLEGAPKTYAFSVHSPVVNYNLGVGLSVVADNYGPVSNTYITLNGAYRIKLNPKLTLSMGLKMGIYNYYASLSGLPINNQGGDPIFKENLVEYMKPNFGLGFYLYHKDYYVGIAAPKLVETALTSNASSDYTMADVKRHFFVIGGYVYNIDRDWNIKPSTFVKMVPGAPVSADITVQGIYQGRYWFGFSYRLGDAVAILLDYKVTPQLLIGYSYDYTLSNLTNYNSGTHEILLSYDFSPLVKKTKRSTVYTRSLY